jgi:GAG-pre-integrase domain
VSKVKGKYIRSFSGKDTPIRHKGTIKWTVNDDFGIARDIIIPNAYHVPDAPVRLLSPQHWAQQVKDIKPNPRGTWCATYVNEIVLQWNQRLYTKTIPLNPKKGNVGTMWSVPGYGECHSCLTIDEETPLFYDASENVTDDEGADDDFDDEPEEPEMMHEEADPTTPQATKIQRDPLKSDFNLDGPDHTNPHLIKPDDLNADPSALMLRWHHRLSHVSMKRIQMMAKSGQLPNSLANCRVPLCQACKYGKASSRPWRTKPSSAHHQNGRSEKNIRDTQDLARTSLIHAARRWPSAVNAHLWPYALRSATDALNKTPTPKHRKTPLEMFMGTKVLPKVSQDHPFGCPVYALDGCLQNRQRIDKWDPRARLGIYLGNSPLHAKTCGLVLSIHTGLVSPQYHVEYDDLFETTRGDQSSDLPLAGAVGIHSNIEPSIVKRRQPPNN